MLKTITLHGAALSGAAGLPRVSTDPVSQAIGGIPGWKVFIDPSEGNANTLPNLARANSAFAPNTGAFEYGSFGAGLDTYVSDDWANAPDKRLVSPVAINPTAFTLFYVINTTAVGTDGNRTLARAVDTVPSGSEEVQFRIDTSNNLRFIRDSGSITAAGAMVDDETALIMATFSTRDGVAIRKDGAELTADATETDPINFGFGAYQWNMLRTPFGEHGMMGALDIDLSWPEHAGYLRQLETYLMTRYGIA